MVEVSDQEYVSAGGNLYYQDAGIGSTDRYSSTSVHSNTYSGWNSLQSKGTISFSAIHTDVSETMESVSYFSSMAPAARAGRPKPEDDGYVPPVGSEMPMGDMLLPMLIMVGVYVGMRVRKFICKHKKIQSL